MGGSGGRKTAIVVGGGIGGLSAAVALERVGWGVEVYERAPELGEVGAGVMIAPNAVKAFRALGLEAALAEAARELDGIEFRTRGGRRIAGVDTDLLRRRYGAGPHHAHRADLHRMLRESLRKTEIRIGHAAVRVRADDSGASVDFEGPAGTVTRDADLVVAADGVWSRSRRLLFGDHPGPTYAGYTVWRGLVPAERAARIGLSNVLSETWGVASRFGTAPVGDGRAYWYACERAEAGAEHEHRAEALAARFSDWHRPVPELLESTPDESLIRDDVHYLAEPLPSFAAGRAVLVGDAAHAATPDIGQGACLAVEDAVVLAAELARPDRRGPARLRRRPQTPHSADRGPVREPRQDADAPGAGARRGPRPGRLAGAHHDQHEVDRRRLRLDAAGPHVGASGRPCPRGRAGTACGVA